MLVYLLVIIFVVIAAGLVTFLLKTDRGEKEPILDLWIAAGFGLVGAGAAGIIEKSLINLKNTKTGASLEPMLTTFIVIAVIEEAVKFLPLAIFLYKKGYFNEHTDGIIYFAIVGLGFGLPENILYTLQYGAKAGMGRLILTPFFHAAITAMVGYYFIKAKLSKKNPFTIWPIFLLVIALHTLYDFGLSSGSGVFVFISITTTLALSVNFFNLLFKAKDQDEDMGLAAVGHNNYCRSCGFVNSHHYLYCTHCGKRA